MDSLVIPATCARIDTTQPLFYIKRKKRVRIATRARIVIAGKVVSCRVGPCCSRAPASPWGRRQRRHNSRAGGQARRARLSLSTVVGRVGRLTLCLCALCCRRQCAPARVAVSVACVALDARASWDVCDNVCGGGALYLERASSSSRFSPSRTSSSTRAARATPRFLASADRRARRSAGRRMEICASRRLCASRSTAARYHRRAARGSYRSQHLC